VPIPPDRQLVLELCQLDLQAPLVRLRVSREDVQDEPAPVDHLDAQERLQRLLLVRAQLVVGNEHRKASLCLRLCQLLGFSLAQVPVRVSVPTVLPLRPHHLGTSRGGQRGELLERILGRPARVLAGVDCDEEGAFGGRGNLDEAVSWHGRATA
jgi:hypothetical protein